MTKKYLVLYYDDGKDEDGNQIFTIHAWPGKSKDDCLKKLNKIMDSKFGKRVRDYDIIDSEPILQIKRELETTSQMQKLVESARGIPLKKKEETKLKTDYSKLSKSELKKILRERNIKTLYHDTLDVLRQKCIESET